MKLSRLVSIATFALLLGAATSSAQNGMMAPSSQLGLGFGTWGGSIAYAISPSMQIGTTLFLNINGGTSLGLGPYFRLLLEGQVNPIIQAGFNFGSVTPTGGTAVTSKALYAAFGANYYPIRNCGIVGLVRLLNLHLDPAPNNGADIGILGGAIGIEWWLK